MGQSLVQSIVYPFLNMGITLASFQASGKVPRLREKLNRWERGSAIRTKASFRSLLLILLGPVACDMSKPLRTLYTSMADTDVVVYCLQLWFPEYQNLFKITFSLKFINALYLKTSHPF